MQLKFKSSTAVLKQTCFHCKYAYVLSHQLRGCEDIFEFFCMRPNNLFSLSTVSSLNACGLFLKSICIYFGFDQQFLNKWKKNTEWVRIVLVY